MDEKILKILFEHTTKIETPLDTLKAVRTNHPFKTLIQTILTAQTKDIVTAPVSKKLFETFGETAQDFSKVTAEELEPHILPVSYYKTKAKHIVRTVQILLEKYNGKVPDTFEELISLPGVGPKTANLMLSEVFGKSAICVDIHVHRISNRIGLVHTKTREQTLKALEETLPKKWWNKINNTLVKHGQTICTPQSPWCSKCPVKDLCPRNGVEKHR